MDAITEQLPNIPNHFANDFSTMFADIGQEISNIIANPMPLIIVIGIIALVFVIIDS